jgi:pyridoxamine 5'-phosphate oxidase
VRRVSELRERHEGEPVPCPDAWGGYRLVPRTVELWEGRPDRLHERLSYEQAPGEGSGWTLCGLEP